MRTVDTKAGSPARERAPDRAYTLIRGAILKGEFGPGDRLTEDALAARAGVSRTPVRSALQRLAQEGFVTFHPNAGALVRGWTAREAVEIFEVRANLESLSASLAARRAGAGDIRELETICDEMESLPLTAETIDSLSALNKRFQMKLLRLSGNRRLEETATTLMEVGFLIRSLRNFSRIDEQRSLMHHRDLVSAVAAGDSDWAAAVMRAHILAASNLFRERARQQEAG